MTSNCLKLSSISCLINVTAESVCLKPLIFILSTFSPWCHYMHGFCHLDLLSAVKEKKYIALTLRGRHKNSKHLCSKDFS